MNIVWDEPKRLANLAKHRGLDFATLTDVFFENALVLPGRRKRWRGIGPNKDGVICVVFARYGREASALSACVPPARRKGKPMRKTSKAKGYTAADMAVVSDNPKWTKDDFNAAKKFAEVFPDLAAAIRRGRGPNKVPTKKLVSLRLSQNVVDHFKSTGPGWQTRIDETLQQAVRKGQPKQSKVAG